MNQDDLFRDLQALEWHRRDFFEHGVVAFFDRPSDDGQGGRTIRTVHDKTIVQCIAKDRTRLVMPLADALAWAKLTQE